MHPFHYKLGELQMVIQIFDELNHRYIQSARQINPTTSAMSP